MNNEKYEDIILRELTLEDYDDFYNYVTEEDIAEQFLFNHDKESANKRLNELVSRYKEENKPFVWAIAKGDTNELVGIISFDNVDLNNKSFSIAYGVRKEFCQHNYAYKATKILVDYAFNQLDMHRFEIACNVDNMASKMTIEKLGATLEGICRESKLYKNEFKDRYIYSILKNEWKLK